MFQDEEGKRDLLDAKAQVKTIEGIQLGIESMKAGRGKTAETFFRELFAKHEIPEE